MPDLEALDGVASASIEAVNGVAKANIEAINGTSVPAAATGATRWALTALNGQFAYAANSDLSAWTRYDAYAEGSGSQNSGDGEIISFGKNASGAGLYIATRSSDNAGGQADREIHYSTTDITDGNEWTNVNLNPDNAGNKRHMQCVMWGARSNGAAAGTWMAGGKQADTGEIYRSVDGGANWSAVDLEGLTGHQYGSNSKHYIQGIASDGQGRWAFCQNDRFYYSTDDGASFAVSTPFSTDAPGRNQGIVYTTSPAGVGTWVVVYSRSSQIRFRSCAASDITDWSDEVDGISMSSPSNNSTNVKIAAANGNVVACSEGNLQINRFTVSGKTIGTVSKTTQTGHGTCKGLATDGTTWVMTCTAGDLISSADNGATWTQRLDGFQADGSSAINLAGIAADVILPL